MQEEILEQFMNYIMTNFQIEKEEIDIDKSLIDEGIIDSFGLIEIAGYIQEKYLFDVKEEDMVKENFGSVNKIVQFIQRKIKIEKSYNKMQKVCSF